jgi:hypothetical protein
LLSHDLCGTLLLNCRLLPHWRHLTICLDHRHGKR